MANIHGPRHVFICRLGHASYQASGSPGYYRCKKIVRTVDEKSEIVTWHPCRKKTIILEKNFARSLFSRGWRARAWEIDYMNRYMGQWLQEMILDAAKA